MSERPDLSRGLDADAFHSFYYLKEELVDFCRKNGLSTSGGKIEITDRISHFLETGKVQAPTVTAKKMIKIGIITEESKIEPEFVCSEKHRAFFKEKIGKSFSFNVAFQKWLKSNTGKTYREAIAAYYQIMEEKKQGKTKIDKQFEDNTYIRDFFADNKGKVLEQAIICWKYKKGISGHNRYEKSDLVALDLCIKNRKAYLEEKTMNDYIKYLSELIPEKDSLKIVKTEAKKFYKEHTAQECYEKYPILYQSDNFQIQEVGVFLAGYIADEYSDALEFLYSTVSQHESWKVQETLAMAFDNYCAKIGYETALPIIKEWFADDCANVRRASSEGLRVWTSRPYFKEHPEIAIELLASHKEDESEYVRKSAGNCLRDISKKFPELVRVELNGWDLSSKRSLHVYKLASKFLEMESI